jgi:hypothetical protein
VASETSRPIEFPVRVESPAAPARPKRAAPKRPMLVPEPDVGF